MKVQEFVVRTGESPQAALRGEPSYVWRAGQERRLRMIARHARLERALVLEAGGGTGMYARQIHERYGARVELFDIEPDRVLQARSSTPHALVAAAEWLPYASDRFDTVLSNEVLEHVQDDRQALQEMIRVLKPGGRAVIFCPNRWYPFETHGHFWRGRYHFGNTPFINWLPDFARNRLAPHVRAYTRRSLLSLLSGCPVRLLETRRIYGGYDNLVRRFGWPARAMRGLLQKAEGGPLDVWGLSHYLVLEKLKSG
ncbi:MAG: methyltransferase domain-containing protein [Anaerolineaceae bacterium]|nr:methyltransferase domain-containing protein [Anaerolineaceae bacterium]MDE0328286.1 methyltransferase domain-containing protein [Anaerolineaceae bacterium]